MPSLTRVSLIEGRVPLSIEQARHLPGYFRNKRLFLSGLSTWPVSSSEKIVTKSYVPSRSERPLEISSSLLKSHSGATP